MGGQIRIRIRFRELKGPWFDYLLVSLGEMKAILAGTGWRLRKIFRSSRGPVYVAVIGKSIVAARRRRSSASSTHQRAIGSPAQALMLNRGM
jgi:hypothetical protein